MKINIKIKREGDFPDHKGEYLFSISLENKKGMTITIPSEIVSLDDLKSFRNDLSVVVHQVSDLICSELIKLEINKSECKHESDGLVYCSNPIKYKCKICGDFYR